jgi:hypothetical protein
MLAPCGRRQKIEVEVVPQVTMEAQRESIPTFSRSLQDPFYVPSHKMSSLPSPRRSQRIAERAARAAAPAPIPAAPKPCAVRKSTVRAAPAIVRRPLTEEEMAAELALRHQLLTEAREIRVAIGAARTPADFKACHDRADALWHTARALLTGGYDEMLISDCCHWLRDGKLGAIEHSWAIDSIKAYINCLRTRISTPPTSTVCVSKKE